MFGMPSSSPILLICQLFPSPVRGGRIPAGSATPEPAPSLCVEDEAVAAAPSCGTWQMEKLGPETSRDWEPPGEVWTETSQAPPGQPCSGSALSKFSMPWVCFFFNLERAQYTKFCMIFCLQLQTFQKLNLLARARRLLPAPGAAKTALEAAQESPAQSPGTSLTPCSAAAPRLRGQGGDEAPGHGLIPVLLGACRSRFLQ